MNKLAKRAWFALALAGVLLLGMGVQQGLAGGLTAGAVRRVQSGLTGGPPGPAGRL